MKRSARVLLTDSPYKASYSPLDLLFMGLLIGIENRGWYSNFIKTPLSDIIDSLEEGARKGVAANLQPGFSPRTSLVSCFISPVAGTVECPILCEMAGRIEWAMSDLIRNFALSPEVLSRRLTNDAGPDCQRAVYQRKFTDS